MLYLKLLMDYLHSVIISLYPVKTWLVHLPLSSHNYVVITLNYERITSLSVGYYKVLQEIYGLD